MRKPLIPQARMLGIQKHFRGFLAALGAVAVIIGGLGLTVPETVVAGTGLAALVGVTAAELLYTEVPKHEGVVLKGYRDPVGIPTKCSGDTHDVVVGKVYTDKQCRVSLDAQLIAHAGPVLLASPELKTRPYILAATTDLTYNIGTGGYRTSSVRKNFDAGNYATGCAAMSAYNRATFRKPQPKMQCDRKRDGRWSCIMPGLVTRRADNRALCERGLA